MISEESSVRDMFQFPNNSQEQKGKKYQMKGHRSKRMNHQTGKPQKWNFTKTVKTMKNVAQFIENLKKRQAQKGFVKDLTLNSKEIQYLQNESQIEGQRAFFCHDNKLILLADILFITIMLLYFWHCTLQMVLGQIDDDKVTINSLALAFYFLHILLQQFTQLKNEKSELITDLNQIRLIYRKEKLLKDLISISALVLQITPLDNHQSNLGFFIAIRFLSLLAYIQMSQVCKKVQQIITISILGETIISFLKLLFKVFTFLHWISLFLNQVAILQLKYGIPQTWLTHNADISYNSEFQKYILGWYWGSTILSTVGFGEIVPKNNIERFIVSIIQVCCCMAFGYFVNTIGQMIRMRSQSSQKYLKEVRSLNRFLSLLTISNDLKHKIRTHYFNKNQVQSMNDPKQEKQVLETITPNLKTSLLEEVNLSIIKKCREFQIFRSDTINSIAHSLKRTILAPEYLLYSHNSTERKIWLIQNGSVEEYTDNFSNSKLRKIISVYHKKQPLLGWINLVTSSPYKTLTKAKNFTVAHELDEAIFLQCIKKDSRGFLKFLESKQLMIEKNRHYDLKCISCGRYTHNVINCPRLHFVKKEGRKLAKQKAQLENYIREQAPKLRRSTVKYDWKKLFGTGQLQKEAHLLINDSIPIQNRTFEKLLQNFAFRESVVGGFQKRRASVMAFNRQHQKSKIIDLDERSTPSVDNQQLDIQIEYDKMFFNQENKDYFPNFNVQNVLNSYYLLNKKNQFRKKNTFTCK